MEPILTPDESRFVILPLKYPDIFDMYKRAVASFWVAEEIELGKDRNDWDNLEPNERYFLSMIIAFFAGSDGIVNENLASRFLNDVQIAEARLFYGFQIAMEGIHQEVYNNIIDTYMKTKEEKDTLFHAIKNFPSIRQKADWAMKYISADAPFAERLVAFACVEGIQFSGAFASIFWCKKRNILRGLCFSNELISRDEALHTEFAVLLYQKLKKKLTPQKIHSIISEAVEIEIEFICEALPCRLIGLNSTNMSQYIKFVANRLALQLGTDKIYPDVSNPYDFIETISLDSKTNFFESRVSEYALAERSGAEEAFTFDANF